MPNKATDEERTANAGVVRVLPERAGDAWCVVAATNATALRGVRFAFLDAVKPTQTNLCFAVSGNGVEYKVFSTILTGSDWVTGGVFGAEASLPAVGMGVLLTIIFLCCCKKDER